MSLRVRVMLDPTLHARGRQQQHGKPWRWRARAKPESRQGQAGPGRVAERPVRLKKAGNAEGGKGPQVRRGRGKERRTPGVARPRTPERCSRAMEPPHAKAKGSERGNEREPGPRAAGREQACCRVRRLAGRRRGRATPETRAASADASSPYMSDPPVCERHDPTGEPVAGNPHDGFGERGAETWQRERLRHRHGANASRESGRRTATPSR